MYLQTGSTTLYTYYIDSGTALKNIQNNHFSFERNLLFFFQFDGNVKFTFLWLVVVVVNLVINSQK